MPLADFAVVHEYCDSFNRVLVHCFDDRAMVLVFISREAIEDYFQLTISTANERNLLIDRNLAQLTPVVTAKFARGEVGIYVGSNGQQFAQIDLSLDDLHQASEPLTDGVLDMAAGAGFLRAQDGKK